MLQHVSVLHSFLLPSNISLYGYCAVLCQSLSCVQLPTAPSLLPTRLLCPWNFPSKNTRAGCHFLLQGIFPIQRSNLRLLIHEDGRRTCIFQYHLLIQEEPCIFCIDRRVLYYLAPPGKPLYEYIIFYLFIH